MDDLQSKISQILSDPQALSELKGLGEQLGLSNASFLSQQEKQSANNNSLFPSSGFSPDMLSMFSKIAPLMSDVSKEDDTQRLLNALRPFLSDDRKKKLDEANKLLKIMKLLPMVKELGVLDSFL
ncbi:MAG: hypothetical protein IJ433_07220 [Ruminococcus sp.]|nr:hypothetical protein [Ruminococcus sp.]